MLEEIEPGDDELLLNDQYRKSDLDAQRYMTAYLNKYQFAITYPIFFNGRYISTQ